MPLISGMLDALGLHVGLRVAVADAITTTGVARCVPFSIIAPPGPHKVITSQVGATALAGNIEVSLDGGVTFVVLQAFDLIANKTISFEVFPGVIYRFNVTSITTTPASIYATLY